MIELVSGEQLRRATERAKAGDLLVQTTNIFRLYRVTNRRNNRRYFVNFFVIGGRRFGDCTCAAGRHNVACKHLSAAAGLHVCVAARRAAAGASTTSH